MKASEIRALLESVVRDRTIVSAILDRAGNERLERGELPVFEDTVNNTLRDHLISLVPGGALRDYHVSFRGGAIGVEGSGSFMGRQLSASYSLAPTDFVFRRAIHRLAGHYTEKIEGVPHILYAASGTLLRMATAKINGVETTRTTINVDMDKIPQFQNALSANPVLAGLTLYLDGVRDGCLFFRFE